MFFRFLLVGGSGFVIDAGLTQLLIFLDFAPWLARIPAIALAMAYAWLANRYFTYRVERARSTNEAMRYAFVSTSMSLLNYLIYVVLVSYGVLPVLAITLATVCQVIVSYHSYRVFVFTER